MRRSLPSLVEDGRVTKGPLASSPEKDGMNGAFVVRVSERSVMQVIASTGEGWEHVSVVRKVRQKSGKWKDQTPSWRQMCVVKGWFWGPDEAVVQYHPRQEDYVNHHEQCLHLWRPLDETLPLPPSEMVGPKAGQKLTANGLEVAK